MKKWIRAHVELTDWINGHMPEAKKMSEPANSERDRQSAASSGLLDEALGRIEVTYDPLRNTLLTSAHSAFEAGFLGPTDAGLVRTVRLDSFEPGSDGEREEANPMTTSQPRNLFRGTQAHSRSGSCKAGAAALPFRRPARRDPQSFVARHFP